MADRARGTATARGYNSAGHAEFRRLVLLKHPVCVGCDIRLSTVADHHPHDRRELIELGLDPNDPTHGRGLCDECHGKATAANQPGGWHDPGH